VGKTRLAIAAGWELLPMFRHGVFFIPLETINNEELLIFQIARSLNMEAVSGQSLLGALKAHLRERQMLLILDNFEQLTQYAGLIADLLEGAGQLKALVTSREALNVYGEVRYIVPELPWPNPEQLPPLAQLSQWPALDLFVQRAQARHPEFVANEENLPAIAQICYRFDGLPLAIELAAAQAQLLLPGSLKTLQNPSRNRPLRQRTLWDAIDWSYQLLSDDERVLFRRLAVFGREWSVDAAQSVCCMGNLPAGLYDLADKSLIRHLGQDEDGMARFQILQSVREYALERLAEHGETAQMQRLHAEYFLTMAEQAEPAIASPDQLRWMRRIKQERENLQIALQWMLDQNETEMAFRALGAVWRYYNTLNIWDEIQAWTERALAQSTHLQTIARVKTLWGAYWLSIRENNREKSLALAEKGLSAARELGDKRLIGLLLQCMAGELLYHDRQQEALQMLEESLLIFRELGDRAETAWVLGHISRFFSTCGDLTKAQEFLQSSLAIFREIGDDWATARILRDLALLFWQRDELEPIKNLLDESLVLSEKMGERMGTAWTFNLQGRLALRESDLVLARTLFEKAQMLFAQLGDQPSISYNQECMEQLASLENER
jgi:non-specific serine/threonine protein kinase